MKSFIFVLIVLMFSVQFGFAVNESNIPSSHQSLNFTEINYTQSTPILSRTEMIVWIAIIVLIIILLIALFVLAYFLSNLNTNKFVFNKISGAEKAITRKGVERAKRLN